MSSPAGPPSPGGTNTTTNTTSNHTNTQSHDNNNNNNSNNDDDQQPYTTHLTSPTHPLTLHNLSPSPASPDASIMASLLSPSLDGPLDAAWARGAITRQRAAAAVPTVTLPPSTHPSSSAGATPAGVISGPKRCDLGIYLLLDDDDDSSSTHSRRRETLIGLSGYGSIKQLHPSSGDDPRPRRVGDAGVLLAEPHRGKGYAAEAMRLSLDLAAAPASEGGLQLDAVSVTTLEDNVAMRALAERRLGLGEGVLRPAEFDKDKREVYWEISTAEWRRRRSSREAQEGPAQVDKQ